MNDGKSEMERVNSRQTQQISTKITDAQLVTFKAMQNRVTDREEYGVKKVTSTIHSFFFIVVLLLAMESMRSSKLFEQLGTYPGFPYEHEKSCDAKKDFGISMSDGQLAIIVCFLFVYMFGLPLINYKYRWLYYQFWIYNPLVYYIVELMVCGNALVWLYIAFSIIQILNILYYICVGVIYAKISKSDRIDFRRIWSIQVIGPWKMAYRRRWPPWAPTHVCMYDGETDENNMPHGFGCWLDDSHKGEIMSGHWTHGIPAAPFISRTYGKGDGCRALRIAYFMAADNDFDQFGNPPSNENPPRVGVASVECSVSGNFYAHLPSAKEMFDPIVFGSEGGSMSDILPKLVHIYEQNDEEKKVGISGIGSSDLQVTGHVYNGNVEDVKQIIVDVKRNDSHKSSKKILFMPSSSLLKESIIHAFPQANGKSVMVLGDIVEESEDESPVPDARFESDDTEIEIEHDNRENGNGIKVPKMIDRLEVRNWDRNVQREALIFFPGWRNIPKMSIQSLGQFMALTQLTRKFYPICYSWPAGTLPTYFDASRLAASQKNRENFLLMLRSLSDAGIRQVHFMTHSMGVQCLLAMFENKDVNDPNSRSDVSLMFQQDPAFDDGTDLEGKGEQLMVCKNIVLINSDFHLQAFIDRAFLSIRRVCSNITVMGDCQDGALRASRWVHSAAVKMGKEYSTLLQSNEMLQNSSRKFPNFKYHSLGFEIHLLHSLGGKDDGGDEYAPLDTLLATEKVENSDRRKNALLFKHASRTFSASDETEKQWLDLDVIDTTSLDSNMAGIRHGGFNMNTNIINDLSELFLEGNRASGRSSLLQREGNTYTYSTAPSHVTM